MLTPNIDWRGERGEDDHDDGDDDDDAIDAVATYDIAVSSLFRWCVSSL